jgi:hypothetical protein
VPGEPFEDLGVGVGVVPGVVPDTGIFNVLNVDADIEETFLEVAELARRDEGIEFSRIDTEWDVRGVREEFVDAVGKNRANSGDRGPEIRAGEGEAQGGTTPGRNAGKVNAVLVDGEAALQVRKHFVDVALGNASCGKGASGEWGGDEERDLRETGEVARDLISRFAGTGRFAKDLAKAHQMV